MKLSKLQKVAFKWQKRNFPDSTWAAVYMGVVEELGELSHALLKQEQGIRGTRDELEAKAKDAVGDMVIYLLNLCSLRGWDFQEILDDTWQQVSKRDWTKNRSDGQ